MSTPAGASLVQIPSFNPFMFWQKQNRNPNQIICAFHLVPAHNRSRFLNLAAFARNAPQSEHHHEHNRLQSFIIFIILISEIALEVDAYATIDSFILIIQLIVDSRVNIPKSYHHDQLGPSHILRHPHPQSHNGQLVTLLWANVSNPPPQSNNEKSVLAAMALMTTDINATSAITTIKITLALALAH